MTTTSTQVDGWEQFKRESLGSWPTPEPFSPLGASLAPLREEVACLTRGRPRKQPPVPVPIAMKYCWACRSVLPLASFATDRHRHDGKKMDCRTCDSAAAYARIQARRARLKLQVTA